MSDAISSFGTLLQISDGASPTEAFTNVGEVRDGSGLARTRTTQETTHHLTAEASRTYIATLKDGGEPTYEVNWVADNATHQQIQADYDSGVARNFRIVYPDNEMDSFAAIITNLTFPSPVDGVRRANLTLRTTGLVSDVIQS
jgi:predicted secreted protein